MAKGRKTGGRQKGTPNKATAEARQVALAFLDRRTADELDALWEKAKAESPGTALRTWMGALEFVMPKLGRQEITGADGAPLRAVFKIEEG
jgi:alpha-D-ribose 1-methylphosphonate 5-triphosphate synthase subunit PhnG